jgi:uncharacterized membrane protein
MLYNFYQVTREALAFCFWTIPTILIGLVLILLGLYYGFLQNKRENDFEEGMEQEEES